MVLDIVLKVISASTSLIIRYKHVREGCFHLRKVHSFEEAYASVTSSFFERCPVMFSEELSGCFPADAGNVKNHPCRSLLSTEGLRKGVPRAGSIL